MNKRKQLFVNMSAQAMCFVVNFLISFFLVPYIGRTVGQEAYGFVGLANDFVGYAQLLTIALNSMASRFITIKIHEKDYKSANKYYSSILISNFIFSIFLIIVSLVFVIYLEKFINVPAYLVNDVKMLFGLIFLNFVFSINLSTFAISTFCTNKLYLSSIRTIESQLFRVGILLVLFKFFNSSVYFVGIASVVCTLYVGVWNFHYIKELLPELKFNIGYFDFGSIKKLLASGFWNTLSKLSSILSSGLDLLITNLFVGSLGMTLLSYSKVFINLILNAFGTISSVFSPELTISYAKKDYSEMKSQLLFSIKIFSLLSIVPLTFLIVFGKNVYQLWLPFQDANLLYRLTVVGGVSLFLSTPLEPMWNLFIVKNKVKQSSLYLIINSFLTIAIVFILLNLYKDNTLRLFIIAGVSTAFSIIRSLFFLPIYGAKCLDIKWNSFYPVILKSVFLSVLMCVASVIVKHIIVPSSWIMLFLSALIIAILFVPFAYYLVFNRDDRLQFRNSILHRVFKKGISN